MPLVSEAGVEAEVDWGQAQVILREVPIVVHLFLMRACHSDASFVMAFESETQQAFLKGHVAALEWFGGVFRPGPLLRLEGGGRAGHERPSPCGVRPVRRVALALHVRLLFLPSSRRRSNPGLPGGPGFRRFRRLRSACSGFWRLCWHVREAEDAARRIWVRTSLDLREHRGKLRIRPPLDHQSLELSWTIGREAQHRAQHSDSQPRSKAHLGRAPTTALAPCR